MARPLVRLAIVVAMAVGVGACSTIADLDPTGLLSDDTKPVPSDQFPADANATPPPDAGTTPDLASLPPRPAATSTPAQQQQVAQAVTADGQQAQYSADALRAGTEAAAPPPTADAAGAQMAVASAVPPSATPNANDLPPTAGAAPAAGAVAANDLPPTASNAAPTPSAPMTSVPAASVPTANVASAAPPPGAMAAVPAVPPDSRPVRSAAAAPVETAALAAPPSQVPGAEPAVPAVPPMGSHMAMLAPAQTSDAALGFRPSNAPPLDASVANFVAAPILAHYRQTASQAGIEGTRVAAVAAVPQKGGRAMGGPDMSGSVVANMDALSGGPGGVSAGNNYGGVPPTAIVYFAGDGTTLSPAGRAKIRTVAVNFKAGGGQGTIRVVGHSASRTANMPVEKHLEVIFEKSQKRANAVAQELIHEGIPADKVMIEAVGDSQPVYYESMPKGEDGNRRAEIFVQG